MPNQHRHASRHDIARAGHGALARDARAWATMTNSANAMEQEARLLVSMLHQAPDGAHFANYAYAFEGGHSTEEGGVWMWSDYQPAFYPSSMTNADIAAKLFANVYGRAPSSSELALWTGELDVPQHPADVLVKMFDG